MSDKQFLIQIADRYRCYDKMILVLEELEFIETTLANLSAPETLIDRVRKIRRDSSTLAGEIHLIYIKPEI